MSEDSKFPDYQRGVDTGSPWVLRSRELRYENNWMRVWHDEVTRPDGTPGIYGFMEPVCTAIGVVALTAADEVILVGQYRYPVYEYFWEIVQGGAAPSEEPLAAIQRELQEEAGLRATQWRELGGEVTLSNCLTAERARIFLAHGLEPVVAAPEVTEVLTVRKVPFAQLLQDVDAGRIKDALTVIAILRLDRERRLARGGGDAR